ncbi:MAG TPA: hypothetical protein VF322_02785, partial [Gammaproteobacteria bacterium]
MTTHFGGCHYGRVRFAVRGPAELAVTECNCSICSKVGYLHYIVSREVERRKLGDVLLPMHAVERSHGQAPHGARIEAAGVHADAVGMRARHV